MIIFIPDSKLKKKWVVLNSLSKEFYPQNREPTSFTKCWNSSKVKSWLPDNKFKIEEI